MKLSAIFISVNLATTLPLAAQAADGIVNENSSWLKQSLAAIEPVRNKPQRKLSLSEGSQSRNILRMMPFVPNRPLPRQNALVVGQQTQSGAYPNNQSLSGAPDNGSTNPLATQVSDYAGQVFINSKRAPFNPPAGPAPRAIPGQNPSLPGQIASNQQTASSIPVIPEPPSTQVGRSSFGNQNSLVDAPQLTPEENEMMHQLLELNQARSTNNSTQASPNNLSSAGPPPFPLNLLPQDSLKQFIGGKHDKINAPPSYFGSWHQRVKVSSLPAGGFQSHVAKYKSSVTRQNQKTSLSKSIAHNGQQHPNQRHNSIIAAEPERIATYAPYPINGKSMTF